jgi:hypothetical protein
MGSPVALHALTLDSSSMPDSPLAAFESEPQSVTNSTENSSFDTIMEKGSPKPTTSSASPHDSQEAEVSLEDHEVYQDNTRPAEVLPEAMASESSPEVNTSTKGSRNSAKSCASFAHSSSACSTSSTYKYEQESFDTFKLKVIQLCHEIGYGEPSEVERMEGGSYNRIISLTFASRVQQRFILRIPRQPLDESQPWEISDQISVLLYLSQFDFLKVPSIVAYDLTTNNSIASQWVLQARLPGQSIQMVFYQLPLAEKLQITTIVAELVMKLERIVLEKPGRLIGKRSLQPVSHGLSISGDGADITGFRECPIEDFPVVEKQHLTSLLIEMLENQKKHALKEDPVRGWVAAEKYEKLQAITREMETSGLIRTYDIENILWHWDFAARNILIDRLDDTSEESTMPIQKATNTVDETATMIENDIVHENQPTKTCQHSVLITVDDTSNSGHKHNIQIDIQNGHRETCKHVVQIAVDDELGRTYRHTLQITGAEGSNPVSKSPAIDEADSQLAEHKSAAENFTGKWAITGVLDWDDALSLPLVLARKPPSWLWCDEQKRSDRFTGNRDIKPERDLTENELLIKAHFDQIMARECPSYIEDTYHRGIWLRALLRFALEGVFEWPQIRRYDKFVADWEEYFRSTGSKMPGGIEMSS